MTPGAGAAVGEAAGAAVEGVDTKTVHPVQVQDSSQVILKGDGAEGQVPIRVKKFSAGTVDVAVQITPSPPPKV